MRVAAVAKAFPPHRYRQEELLAGFRRVWGSAFHNPERLEKLHRNVQVGARYLALPLEAYEGLDFTAANDAFIRGAVEVGARALESGLAQVGLGLRDVDHLFFVSVTGIATPSVDALLANRLGMRPDLKRTPIFGLGCVAGVAGVARATDYLRAFPEQVAVLLSVELCSLTLQREDLSIANLVASGLFGDGAAAAVLVGSDHPRVGEASGPRVVATRSVLYPGTEEAMGWRIGSDGFRVVLSAEVPEIVARHVGEDVDAFLAGNGLRRADVASWVCHPGGPRVIEALQRALGLPGEALDLTWRSLREVGNLSSASVLMVLADTIAERRPPPGSHGVMMAMGPGFCAELALLAW